MPSAEQFTVYAADLDSCIISIETGELIRLFPSLQMASLVDHPVFIKDLKDVVCVAEFGYKIWGAVCFKIIMQAMDPKNKNRFDLSLEYKNRLNFYVPLQKSTQFL